MRWMERLIALNEEWNDLPRRILWIVLLIGCIFAALFALPYVAPFVLAGVFAWIIDPAVRLISRWLGGSKASRNIVSALFVLVISALVITLLLVIIGRVLEEIIAFAAFLPGWIGTASGEVIAWIDSIELEWPVLEAGLEEIVRRLLADVTSIVTSFATRIASGVARGAWHAASMLPQAVLFIVLTLMGTFYMSSDKDRIIGYLRSLLPEKYQAKTDMFRASILRAVLGQLRAGFIMLCVTFGELSLGFLLMGLDYAVLLALVIAVLDALPVIGAGLFLIPMCIYGIVVGNGTLAIGSGLIYLMTIIVRQLLEPRIIGRHLGLYPLATMMAMYAGLRSMGFLGLVLGPLILLLCKVALTAGDPPKDTLDPPGKPGWIARLLRRRPAKKA